MTANQQDKALGARLAALRAELTKRRLDGFVIPRADAHLGEYVAADCERLAWITGFTGSAGIAVVLGTRAAIFVDGRYTLQVRDQVEGGLFEFCHLSEQPAGDWIAEHLTAGQALGIDPWLHSQQQIETLSEAVAKVGASLALQDDNPIDAIWTGRPSLPASPVVAHPLEYAGIAAADKRAQVAGEVVKRGADAAVLSLPDSLAWLLNVRGGDVTHSPLPQSFAVLHADGAVQWFLDPAKVTAELRTHIGNGVAIQDPGDLGPVLDQLGANGKAVLADPATAASWIFERLRTAGATLINGSDPCQLPKACKNPVELAGTRAAHVRDGQSLVRFLAWLDREAEARARAGNPIDEVEAAKELLARRRENELFQGPSFDTISGAGANGAIVHYRADEASSAPLGLGELYLVDSGGQYLDGTTDVTRTLAIGAPSAEARDRFTRVLKGHIALALARFPRGTTGSQLDALARYSLWQVGLDYDHGTGHGVGSYLNVHEGPQRISKAPSPAALKPGMIVSNEPGYYKTGAYGIRIENLVVVVESPAKSADEKDMLAFETLTLAPIDHRLIDASLLNREEIDWLDAYHARVRAAHRDALDAESAAWIDQATRPLA